MRNLVNHSFNISRFDREKLHKHKAILIWFTGLSGSGKSTIANSLEIKHHEQNISTYVLDGDNIRLGINKDLSFLPKDRTENIRRIGEIAKLLVDAGIVTLATFVSPYIADRDRIKDLLGEENFIEIFINTSIVECERRDVKGLYKKARAGNLKNFTGIDSPYEAPENPEIEINTAEMSVEDAAERVINGLIERGIIEV